MFRFVVAAICAVVLAVGCSDDATAPTTPKFDDFKGLDTSRFNKMPLSWSRQNMLTPGIDSLAVVAVMPFVRGTKNDSSLVVVKNFHKNKAVNISHAVNFLSFNGNDTTNYIVSQNDIYISTIVNDTIKRLGSVLPGQIVIFRHSKDLPKGLTNYLYFGKDNDFVGVPDLYQKELIPYIDDNKWYILP